jgi:hypothetical protein
MNGEIIPFLRRCRLAKGRMRFWLRKEYFGTAIGTDEYGQRTDESGDDQSVVHISLREDFTSYRGDEEESNRSNIGIVFMTQTLVTPSNTQMQVPAAAAMAIAKRCIDGACAAMVHDGLPPALLIDALLDIVTNLMASMPTAESGMDLARIVAGKMPGVVASKRLQFSPMLKSGKPAQQ